MKIIKFILFNPFHYFLTFLVSLVFYFPDLSSLIDLEEKGHSFVLETKQVMIPGYPDAFNPSLTQWGSSLLMCFRIRDPLTLSTDQIGFIWLDEEFNPVGNPYLLQGKLNNSSYPSRAQDPRLLVISDHLYMIYNNVLLQNEGEIRRMFLSEVQFDGSCFSIDQPECLLYFEGSNKQRLEKNWVPFSYKNKIHLAYSISPHHIMCPELKNNGKCINSAYSKSLIQWKWGELRGGTPALLDEGHYLAFFHSCMDCATVQSKGVKMPHYFMGIYTFSSKPPFEIQSISPEPILSKHFYDGPPYQTWKPLRVVFPGGIFCNEKYVWVAYGKQDHEIWIAKMDKQKLKESLSPVSAL